MAQAFGHGPQQRIANRMPERVIDVLETIQIQENHADLFIVTFGLLEGLFEPFFEMRTVRQSGQGIVLRLMVQAVIQVGLFDCNGGKLCRHLEQVQIGFARFGGLTVVCGDRTEGGNTAHAAHTVR